MPSSPVPLIELPEGIVTIAEVSTAPAATPKREQDWVKTFDSKHIPFPEGENPEHVELV
ncbi:hypothetical protein E4U60_000200, partial [Claviceps pazoutovae]